MSAAPEETLDRAARAALQSQRLRETLARAAATPLYYGRITDLSEITSVHELGRVPLTTKADLRALSALADGLAVPLERVRRWHASSGTTGRRTAVGYTREDLELWATLTARALAESGIGPGTVVHNAFGYGLFTGGLGFQLALDRLGATVIPASVAPSIDSHLELMREFDAQALLCTPSFAARIAARVEAGAPRPASLRVSVHGGESWTPALKARIARGLGVEVFDTYGLSEVIGPGVAHECRAHRGLHLYEDHFLAEVLAPGGAAPVADGEVGELVITTLSATACPRLRYRTEDLVRLDGEPCGCGRTTRRIVEVLGRIRDGVRVGGGEVMPSAIESALLGVEGVGVHYQLVLGAERTLTAVVVEPARALGPGEEARLTGEIAEALSRCMSTEVPVEVVAPGSLPRSNGKAPRVRSAG